jgi:hypothetical protein
MGCELEANAASFGMNVFKYKMKMYLVEAAAKGLYIQLDAGVARPESATSFKENEHVSARVDDVRVTVRADDGYEEMWLLTKKPLPKPPSAVVEKPFHINDLIMNELYYMATTLVLCVNAFGVGVIIGVVV